MLSDFYRRTEHLLPIARELSCTADFCLWFFGYCPFSFLHSTHTRPPAAHRCSVLVSFYRSAMSRSLCFVYGGFRHPGKLHSKARVPFINGIRTFRFSPLLHAHQIYCVSLAPSTRHLQISCWKKSHIAHAHIKPLLLLVSFSNSPHFPHQRSLVAFDPAPKAWLGALAWYGSTGRPARTTHGPPKPNAPVALCSPFSPRGRER